jgi:prophage tail gpP-like protein
MLERNKWEYNIRKSRSQVYSATVHGFRNQTGNLWAINELINVEDEFAGINSRMLVNSVQFSLSDGGRQTILSLIHKDAYTLTLPTQTSIDKLGEGLVEESVTEPIVIDTEDQIPAWIPWTPQAEFGNN